MSRDDSFTFDGADGAKIFTYRWRPDGPRSGSVNDGPSCVAPAFSARAASTSHTAASVDVSTVRSAHTCACPIPLTPITPTLTTGASAVADPLASVPALNPALCGTTYTQYAAWDSGGFGSSTIPPGVSGAVACYPSISIHGSASVTMAAGSYLVSGPITVTNSGTLAANGVFIYLSCNSGVGSPPPAIACTSGSGQAGGSISITGSSPVTITAPNSGTYQGLAIMADRFNTNANGNVLNLGGSGVLSITGTVYAASGKLNLSGAAASTSFSSRFVVGTVVESGSSSVTITYTTSQNYATPGTLKLTA